MKKYLVCINNLGYEASLEKRKIYQFLVDEVAAQAHLISVIDESGESYLYPENYFDFVDIPDMLEAELNFA